MNDLAAAVLLPLPVSLSCSALIAWLGHRMSLVDNPNERSSHTNPTPRGGGLGIWIAFTVFGLVVIKDIFFALLAGALGLVGFLEDRFTLSQGLRLSLQFAISVITVYFTKGVPVSLSAAVLFLFWIVFITGTLNFFNFMDGINGIAGLTGIVGFGLTAIFSYFLLSRYDILLMSVALSAACLGFLPFNFPKAKVFMGDVGSVLLGFVFASFVARLSANINIFLCLVMFLCTFYADAAVTIFFRWRRGENLMKAHRGHLYQYLSNELGLAHWKVSLTYATIQLMFGICAVIAFSKGIIWQLVVPGIFSVLFLLVYTAIKKREPKQNRKRVAPGL